MINRSFHNNAPLSLTPPSHRWHLRRSADHSISSPALARREIFRASPCLVSENPNDSTIQGSNQVISGPAIQPYDSSFPEWLQIPLLSDSSSSQSDDFQVMRDPSPTSSLLAPKRARKGREKTELCRFYLKGLICPFRDMCSYAHGQKELRTTCLENFVQSAEEAKDFRCRPCQTWVSTGACPYKSRCSFLHDPRVKGPSPSWIASKDMPSRGQISSSESCGSENNFAAEGLVDAYYNERCSTLNKGNPFGMANVSLHDLYVAACNLNVEGMFRTLNQLISPGSDSERNMCLMLNLASTKQSASVLTERHRLEIALSMRGKNEGTYEFWPTHLLFGKEGCMILQKKAFIVLPSAGMSSVENENHTIIDVGFNDIDYYKRLGCNFCVIHELAFGPSQKKNVLPVSLWFDLEEDIDLVKCSNQESKRLVDEIKSRNRAYASADQSVASIPMENLLFTTSTPFFQLRPSDNSAFGLVTRMIHHRLRKLQMLSDAHANLEESTYNDALDTMDQELIKDFQANKTHWDDWHSWPPNMGFEVPSTLKDSVPAGESVYEIHTFAETSIVSTKHAKRRWDAFVDVMSHESIESIYPEKIPHPRDNKARRRLSVLESLASAGTQDKMVN